MVPYVVPFTRLDIWTRCSVWDFPVSCGGNSVSELLCFVDLQQLHHPKIAFRSLQFLCCLFVLNIHFVK